VIRLEGAPCQVHRLAFLYVTGSWPSGFVDHINGNPLDNRFCNLRDVPKAINCQNLRRALSNNKCGLLGASPRHGKWAATIMSKGVRIHIGTFNTPEEAHAAYVSKKRELHPGCTL
jgi:hypothetical protein